MALEFAIATEEEIRAALLAEKRTRMPEYTDENDSDTGMLFLNIFAFLGNLMRVGINVKAAECLLHTAMQEQSVINICRYHHGYKLRPNMAAKRLVTFAVTDSCTIPAGTRIAIIRENGEEILFETDEELEITAGGDYEVYATQGETRIDTFSANGSANQAFQLTDTPYIYGSLRVVVSSVDWSLVSDFIRSGASDKDVVMEIDANDVVTIKFGDGYNGEKPASGTDNVVVTYRVGGGDIGNLGGDVTAVLKDTIAQVEAVSIESPASTVLTQDVALSHTTIYVESTTGFRSVGTVYIDEDEISYTGKTETSFSGVTGITVGHQERDLVTYALGNDPRGRDKESIQSARWNAPASLKCLDRCVSLTDYETVAENYPGVAQARAYREAFTVAIAIVPTGGGSPPSALKSGVQSYLAELKCVNDNITVQNPVYVYVDVSVNVQPAEFVDFDRVLRPRVERMLNDYLSPVYRDAALRYVHDWGRDVRISEVYTFLNGIVGVSYVTLVELKRSPEAANTIHDIVVNDNQIITAGTISIARISSSLDPRRTVQTPGSAIIT